MSLAPLKLKKNEERRILGGHVWVYSNEVDTKETPLTEFSAGQLVDIISHNGKVLGNGYVNAHSLICARMVSRDSRYQLDQSLITHRLKIALSLRERLFKQPCYRLVHGESDMLPGLVVDRYFDTLVVQLGTAGMEVLKEQVIAALDKAIKPKAILLRNDGAIRKMEGLESYIESALGEVPEQVELVENGVKFLAPIKDGQKTGWFYDHRMNRARMQNYVQGKRVLDVFSYIGGWGVQAATAGADEVMCIDSSSKALDRLHHNGELNGVADKISCLEGDAFAAMKALREDRERFDVIILDPPAFIKRKKDIKEGTNAYRRANQMAMQLLSKDGILISGSCSHHLSRSSLQSVMQQSARHLDRNMQILEQGHQGPDHPVHPVIPETDYLKAIFSRVLHR